MFLLPPVPVVRIHKCADRTDEALDAELLCRTLCRKPSILGVRSGEQTTLIIATGCRPLSSMNGTLRMKVLGPVGF